MNDFEIAMLLFDFLVLMYKTSENKKKFKTENKYTIYRLLILQSHQQHWIKLK